MVNKTHRDEDGLETFLSERERLMVLAQSIVRNPAIAEELVQDSWLRWGSRSYPTDRIKPILNRIVANLCRDWLRRQKAEKHGLDYLGLFSDTAPDTERIVISRQDLAIVMKAIGTLPRRTAHALYMNRIEGMTCAEIGTALDVSTQRAHQLVRSALVHIALHLGDDV
ncbi:MAG: RNA polymerase sigma factor [Pseudomonadota bacterium]